MPNEKPTGGAPEETPARSNLMPAMAWMVYGIGLSMLTMFVRTLWFQERGDVNAMFVTAAWVVGVGIAVPALLNCLQGWVRILKVVGCSLFTSVAMAGMCLFLGGTVVSDYYYDAPQIQAFAANDFDSFETNGVVSKTALDAALKEDADTRAQLAQLAATHKAIDSSNGTAASKWAANTGLAALETDLKLRLLQDDELARMSVVSRDMHVIGSNGEATQAQLLAYRQHLHEQFPQWEWLLRKVNAID